MTRLLQLIAVALVAVGSTACATGVKIGRVYPIGAPAIVLVQNSSSRPCELQGPGTFFDLYPNDRKQVPIGYSRIRPQTIVCAEFEKDSRGRKNYRGVARSVFYATREWQVWEISGYGRDSYGGVSYRGRSVGGGDYERGRILGPTRIKRD